MPSRDENRRARIERGRYAPGVLIRAIHASVLCFWVAGCGGGCSGLAEEDPDPAARSEARATGGEATSPDAPVVDPGPAPSLRVLGVPETHGRTVAIRVENHGAQTELTGAVTLQQRDGDAWADVDGASLDLRFSCREEAPECLTLAPGAVLLPPPWLGTIGDAQCICTRCGPAEAGTYRFVVRSCNGAHEALGEPFALR